MIEWRKGRIGAHFPIYPHARAHTRAYMLIKENTSLCATRATIGYMDGEKRNYFMTANILPRRTVRTIARASGFDNYLMGKNLNLR